MGWGGPAGVSHPRAVPPQNPGKEKVYVPPNQRRKPSCMLTLVWEGQERAVLSGGGPWLAGDPHQGHVTNLTTVCALGAAGREQDGCCAQGPHHRRVLPDGQATGPRGPLGGKGLHAGLCLRRGTASTRPDRAILARKMPGSQGLTALPFTTNPQHRPPSDQLNDSPGHTHTQRARHTERGPPGPAAGRQSRHPGLVGLPDMSWKLMTWFIRAVDKMTSSKTGTLPPTMPVFPPCGFTARFLS